MDLVTFGQQELGEIGAILSGDAGDKCLLHLRVFDGEIRNCPDVAEAGTAFVIALITGPAFQTWPGFVAIVAIALRVSMMQGAQAASSA